MAPVAGPERARHEEPTMTTTTALALDPERLYEGDNGRVTCGGIGCAGASAACTGRTIAGQPVRALGMADVREWAAALGRAPRCEGCGREAMAVLDARGRVSTRAGGAR